MEILVGPSRYVFVRKYIYMYWRTSTENKDKKIVLKRLQTPNNQAQGTSTRSYIVANNHVNKWYRILYPKALDHNIDKLSIIINSIHSIIHPKLHLKTTTPSYGQAYYNQNYYQHKLQKQNQVSP